MSTQSQELRARAASDRAAAEKAVLLNTKTTLLASAARNDELAAQAERLERMKQMRVSDALRS